MPAQNPLFILLVVCFAIATVIGVSNVVYAVRDAIDAERARVASQEKYMRHDS